MFYYTGMKADSSWLKYFCFWWTSSKTSHWSKITQGKIVTHSREQNLNWFSFGSRSSSKVEVNFSIVVSTARIASCGAIVFVWENLSTVPHSAAFSISEVSLKRMTTFFSKVQKKVTHFSLPSLCYCLFWVYYLKTGKYRGWRHKLLQS